MTLLPLLAGLFSAVVSATPVAAVVPPNVRDPIVTKARNAKDAVLVIGNEAYLRLPQVTWAGNDAQAFEGWARRTHGVPSFRTRVLANTSRKRILKEANRVAYRVRRGGTLWVYYAGHGAVNDRGERMLLGTDSRPDTLDRTGVRLSELVRKLERSRRARRVVLVLDTSFGNSDRDGFVLVPGREVQVDEGYAAVETARTVVWSATSGAEAAVPFVAAKHGLFTWTVLGALRGWADGAVDGQADGRLTLEELQTFSFDAGRALGHPVTPTAARPDAAAWVLEQGGHFEAAPAPAVMAALGRADLVRRLDEAEAALRADATAFWADTLVQAQQGGQAGREALRAYIDEFSRQEASLSWAVSVPEVAVARAALANFDMQTVELEVGEPITATQVSCVDLLGLESAAMMGELSSEHQACLDRRVVAERLQTDKAQVSKLLLVNAEAAGDRAEWQRLMQRHLEDIDRSEPDLCFAYALFLHRKGELEDAEDVVRWAGYALENKQAWQGKDHVAKVLGLLRLRSESANQLWIQAEKAYRRDGSEESEAISEAYRGWTKDFAREWLDFSRAANDASKRARQMCEAASGSAAFCAPGAPR